MAETYREYPTMEVALSCFSKGPSGPEMHDRIQAGDIVGIRNPLPHIGLKEGKLWIWLRIDGLELNEFDRLAFGNPDGDYNPNEAADLGLPNYEKRRFCIPFQQLKKAYPAFNIDRALDPDDTYQPFMILDKDDYAWLTGMKPLNANGLIFDRVYGRFI